VYFLDFPSTIEEYPGQRNDVVVDRRTYERILCKKDIHINE
jgi:hypothetical protein